MNIRGVVFAACSSALLHSANAHAETTEWSVVAMNCTPSHSTVQQNRYITTAGRVKFKPGATGLISFICPLTSQLPTGKYKLKAFQSVGTGTAGVELRRAHVRSGAVSTMLAGAIFLKVPSDEMGVLHSGNPQNTINFDLENFVYWVQITIRTNNPSAQSPSVLGAALSRQ